METKRKPIDVEDRPELLRLVEDIRADEDGLEIRQHGRTIAVVSPIRDDVNRPARKVVTPEDLEAFRSAAGGWKDVDTDKLLEDIYADRDMSVDRGVIRDVSDR